MRIWHEKLIPKLCRQHLLAVWREGLGCFKIITENKKGYRNHPATKEFINAPRQLLKRLHIIRAEMLSRGYNPKEIPKCVLGVDYGMIDGEKHIVVEVINEWQTLGEQIARLKEKKCNCKI